MEGDGKKKITQLTIGLDDFIKLEQEGAARGVPAPKGMVAPGDEVIVLCAGHTRKARVAKCSAGKVIEDAEFLHLEIA